MTISLRGVSAALADPTAVTAVNPAVHASAAAGDLSILTVVAKPYTTTITTPTNWTKITEWTNGTTASGVDVGSTKVAMYARESAPTGAIGAITQSGADSMTAAIVTYAKTGAAWDYSAFAVGSDAVNGTNYSATANGGMGLEVGDQLVCGVGINSDLAITGALVMTFAGATLGTLNTRASMVNGQGNDTRVVVVDAAVTARTTSIGPPVFSHTSTNSSSGSNIWLRLREVATSVGPVLATQQMVKVDASSSASLVSAPFTFTANDVIVVKFVNGDNGQPVPITPTMTGGTFTVRGSFVQGSKTNVYIWTAVPGSAGSSALSLTFSGGAGYHSAVFERWTNASLAGTPATVSTSGNSIGPSATITTVGNNSAVTWASGDWAAVAQGTIAPRSSAVIEGTTGGDATNYTAYFLEQDAPSAGSNTVGMTTPATAQNWALVGMEILATSAPPAVPPPLVMAPYRW